MKSVGTLDDTVGHYKKILVRLERAFMPINIEKEVEIWLGSSDLSLTCKMI